MEDFLPLLIGIIWLAYTWYSKEQKKKQKASAGGTKEPKVKKEPSILEQILMGQEIKLNKPEEHFEYVEEEEEQVYEKPEPVKHMTAKSDPFLKSEISKYMEEGESAFQIEDSPMYLEEIDEDEHGYFRGAMHGHFNLRKAVIYSEILRPPYIDYK